MSERRPQDSIDAERLLTSNEALDVDRVRANLRIITARGFHRDQDLLAKLDGLLARLSAR